MNFLEYILDEKMDSFQEGIDMYEKCLDLVVAGSTDEEIAAALEKDLDRIQSLISRCRKRAWRSPAVP